MTDVPAAVVVRWTALPDTAELTPDRAAALRATLPNVEPPCATSRTRLERTRRDGRPRRHTDPPARGHRRRTRGRTAPRARAGVRRAAAPTGSRRSSVPPDGRRRPCSAPAAPRRASRGRDRPRGARRGRARRDRGRARRRGGAGALPPRRDARLDHRLARGIRRPPLGGSRSSRAEPSSTRGARGARVGRRGRPRAAHRGRRRRTADRRGRGDRALAVPAVRVAARDERVGRVDVDPVAVLAPVLVLLALSLLALGLTGPVGAVLERLAAARPALVPALPMRQLARRAALYASASFVTMLAVAGLTLTAAFAGAWQGIDRHMSALAAGGDVRVAFAGRDLVRGADPLALADPFADVDGITADAPVFRGEIRIGSDPATLVAAPGRRARAGRARSGADAAAGLLAARRGRGNRASRGGVDDRRRRRRAAPAGTAGRVAVSAWLLTPGGAATRLPAGEVDIAAGGAGLKPSCRMPRGCASSGCRRRSWAPPGRARCAWSSAASTLTVSRPTASRRARRRRPGLVSSTEPEARASLTTGGSDPLPVVSPRSSPRASRPRSVTASPSVSSRAVPSSTRSSPARARGAHAGTNAVFVDLGALSRAAFDEGGGVPQFGNGGSRHPTLIASRARWNRPGSRCRPRRAPTCRRRL